MRRASPPSSKFPSDTCQARLKECRVISIEELMNDGNWSPDFSLYVLFLDGLHSIPTNTYIAASFFSKQAGEEGGAPPLSEYLRFYLL
jgi:hypothetical protein